MKIPPQAKEIEQAVIAAVLLESKAINEVTEIISPEIFYFDKNRLIWEAILTLHRQNTPIDILTVSNELKTGSNALQDVFIYLVELTNSVGGAANIQAHAHILKERYIRRRLIELQTKSAQMLYDDGVDVFEELNKLITEIEKINSEVTRLTQITFSEAVASRVLELKEAAKHNYRTGIESGLNDVDRVTLGFQPSDLIILAARPAMGKTAFAVDIARVQAKNQMAVGIFSLEMSVSQLIDRILASETEVDLGVIRKGGLNVQQWQKLDDTTLRVMEYPMFVCDKGGLSVHDVVSIAKGWKLKHDIKILYIDYIQLLSGSGNKGQSREQEVSEISRKLKGLAKELNIPIIGLSQLSRAVEQREGKKPQLSDLRESGSLEQDSDIVMFCYRPIYYGIQEYEIAGKTLATDDLYMILVGKHRNGETGEIPLQLIKEQTLLKNYPAFIFSAPSSNNFEPAAPMKRNTEFDDFDNNQDTPF
jgi:replicative DNA helicase